MAKNKRIHARTERRALRTKKSLTIGNLPRVSVFRSLTNIYAQVIDDNAQRTLASCSSLELRKDIGADKDKRAAARMVGKELAKRALSSGVNRVCFDRGSYLYHGRVKELAEGLREGGLQV